MYTPKIYQASLKEFQAQEHENTSKLTNFVLFFMLLCVLVHIYFCPDTL